MFDWFDWNGNGKIDDEDRMLSFMVFNEVMEEENSEKSEYVSSQTGHGGWLLLGAILFILVIILG